MNKTQQLIIVASGLGTRLAEYTDNAKFPKLMISIGQETLLQAILKSASKVTKEVVIITHIKYAAMLQQYIDNFVNLDIDVVIRVHNEADGSANALLSVCKDLNNDALVMWSDILCKHKQSYSIEPLLRLKQTSKKKLHIEVAADKIKRHRYLINDGAISEVSNAKGNVVGAYYINDVKRFYNVAKSYAADELRFNYDLIDIVAKLKRINECSVGQTHGINFVDIGDSVKYEDFMSTINIETRYFNNLSVYPEIVVKTPNCDKGVEIMQFEAKHYGKCSIHAPGVFAKHEVLKGSEIAGYGEFAGISLERLDKTMQEHLDSGSLTMQECYDKFMSTINILHNSYDVECSNQEFMNAILAEYIDVTTKRFLTVQTLVTDAKYSYLRFNATIARLEHYLIKYYEDNKIKPTLIHGDTNSSNVMTDFDGNVKLIDPRGYFGELMHIGDSSYDIAKFVYGITGYANFNKDTNFKLSENSKQPSYIIDIDDLESHGIVVDKHIKILVALIWLKLPAYIINNPLKAIFAFRKGLDDLEKLLNEADY